MFSQTVADFWRGQFLSGDVLQGDESSTIAINPNLTEGSRAMVLECRDGRVAAVVTPGLAEKLDLRRQQDLSDRLFRQRLDEAGVTLNGADFVFYFPEAAGPALLQEKAGGVVRQLTARDGAVFSEFQAAASEQDLDDAYVELDHWAVFGAFEHGRLICVASMYPWQNARIADLGVLTLAPFRGKGYAREVVRSISRHAFDQGYEPQYRCQTDNLASVALAKAAGLTLFGKWEVVSPDSAV